LADGNVCADVNLLGDKINIIKEHTAVTDDSMQVGLEVNTERTKYMLMACHQNAGQNHNTKTGNRAFENVAKLK
jgi:hypothetical protein